MRVRDIIPLIDKEQPIAIIDQNGVTTLVQPRDIGMELMPIIDKPLTQITRYRLDPYAEEDYVALRIVYNKGEVI